MSRPWRAERKTAFCYGEGEAEYTLLKHIKGLYARGLVAVKVQHSAGGGPKHIIAKAVTVRGNPHNYNQSIILLDGDLEIPGPSRVLAKSRGFVLLENLPNIEGFFLRILEPGTDIKDWDSKRCKEYFQKKYGVGEVITDRDCERLFPEKVITAASGRIKVLSELVKIMKGQF